MKPLKLAQYNLVGRIVSISSGAVLGLSCAWILSRLFVNDNSRMKNRSALHADRLIPDGEDPWKY